MKNDVREIRVCPLCGQTYGEAPALSRTDNETLICPDCGTRQAASSTWKAPRRRRWKPWRVIGVSAEEQEKILAIIHRAYRP